MNSLTSFSFSVSAFQWQARHTDIWEQLHAAIICGIMPNFSFMVFLFLIMILILIFASKAFNAGLTQWTCLSSEYKDNLLVLDYKENSLKFLVY